jgi:hypothetical protein
MEQFTLDLLSVAPIGSNRSNTILLPQLSRSSLLYPSCTDLRRPSSASVPTASAALSAPVDPLLLLDCSTFALPTCSAFPLMRCRWLRTRATHLPGRGKRTRRGWVSSYSQSGSIVHGWRGVECAMAALVVEQRPPPQPTGSYFTQCN